MTATAIARPARRTGTWSFWLVGAGLFVMLLSANLPTPLYAVYRQRFGFSGAVLTLIFATYAVVLIPSLLLFGQLSDRIGRRRVIALGLAAATAAMVLFAVARGTGWLFAARAMQGLAVGVITGTATAALVGAFPARSLPLLLAAAVLAGAGLGFGFIGAQTQINELAPARRRGEVTAAFITCVYLGVTVAAITVGLLGDALSLFPAVAVVSGMIAAVAVPTAVAHRIVRKGG